MGSIPRIKVGIVGPCGSGKSTLIRQLKEHKIWAEFHHIAQEHSYVKDMWQRIVNPHFLIYLDASYETATLRRKLNWTLEEYQEQCQRLTHAREHADLCIKTDSITELEVFSRVEIFLRKQKVFPSTEEFTPK
jgi:deoxyadenosine/deoxycytidine kinase